MKSGIQTSEFWLTISVVLAAIVIAVLMIIHLPNLYGGASAVVAVAMAFYKAHRYELGRIALKLASNHQSPALVEKTQSQPMPPQETASPEHPETPKTQSSPVTAYINPPIHPALEKILYTVEGKFKITNCADTKEKM
jgi:hypothetical protein